MKTEKKIFEASGRQLGNSKTYWSRVALKLGYRLKKDTFFPCLYMIQ